VQHDPHLADSASFRVRSADRTEASISCTVVRVDGTEFPGEVQNLSPGGALLASAEVIAAGTFLTLRFVGDETVSAEVKWNDGPHCGCRFPRSLTVRQYLRLRQGADFVPAEPEKTGFMNKLRALLPRKA
jgi:hypothetical protein